MPRSAGNPNMSSKVDASGSSSMSDVHQWFRGSDSSWGKKGENRDEKTEGALNFSGLGPEVTEEQVRTFFGKFYSTVTAVRLQLGGGGRSKGFGQVIFRFAGERDKAVRELNGRELAGHRLNLTKSRPPEEKTPGGAPAPTGPLSDTQIHAMLLQREARRLPAPRALARLHCHVGC